jgi:FAD/FMN-containing dehydrogenase
VASFNDLEFLSSVLPKILEFKPSMLEMINRSAVAEVSKINPNQLADSLDSFQSAMTLFIEFDDFKGSTQKKKSKKLQKLLEKNGAIVKVETELEEQNKLLKVRESVSTLINYQLGQSHSIPVAEDVSVPVESIIHFLQKAELVFEKHGLQASVWGHAGDGVVRMQPRLNLMEVGDRQKFFKLPEEIYQIAVGFGGSITASHGEGRVKAVHLPTMFGEDIVRVFEKVKLIFDPMGIINPGVKVGVDNEAVKQLIRNDYSLGHRHDYLPKT